MSDPNDKNPEEGPVTGRQTIREVMAAVRVAQEEEMHQEVLADRKKRKEATETRIKTRRERQVKQAREVKARRYKALKDSQGKMTNHVTAASRALRAALEEASSVQLPRHSPEAREQVRIRRSIEGALSALRQVGRGTFNETDVDLDFDLETGT